MLGKRIGQGMSAEVYEWGNDRVAKLFRPECPADWIAYEARIGKAVRAAGVPAPDLEGPVEIEGKLALLYERMPGTSLLEWIFREPERAESFAQEMARLHVSVHRCFAPGLPRQKDRLMEAIRQSQELLGESKLSFIRRRLEKLPEGDRICHGDFHPDNILYDGRTAAAIDWTDASSGHPLGDVMRTSLMLTTPYVPPGTPAELQQAIPELKRRLNESYLAEYDRLSGIDPSKLNDWFVPVAAARLRERIPGEREWLLERLDREMSQEEERA